VCLPFAKMPYFRQCSRILPLELAEAVLFHFAVVLLRLCVIKSENEQQKADEQRTLHIHHVEFS